MTKSLDVITDVSMILPSMLCSKFKFPAYFLR